MAMVLGGCSLFEDVDSVRYRPGAFVPENNDLPDASDASNDATLTDLGLDATSDAWDADIEDLSPDVFVPQCRVNECGDNQVCVPEEGCVTVGPCATEGCPRGLICNERGLCQTCTTDDECGTGAFCNQSFCECDGVQNFCAASGAAATSCVPTEDIRACGPSCDKCPTPPTGATSICKNDTCDFECNPKLIRRDMACVPFGGTCNTSDTPLLPGNCDPVGQTGCAATEQCNVVRLSATNYERRCAPIPTQRARLGEACTMVACEAGLGCFAGTCRRFCDVTNGAGCMLAETCAPPLAPTPGIGFCDEDCAID